MKFLINLMMVSLSTFGVLSSNERRGRKIKIDLSMAKRKNQENQLR